MTRIRLVLLSCLLAQAVAFGQSSPGAGAQGAATSPPPQTFRSGVQIIEVDVFVTGRDGEFVRDLTADDFEILEDGVPQEVRAFSFVDLPIEPRVPPAPDAEDLPEPDVTTNDLPDGRIYVILMDGPSTAPPGGTAFRSGPAYDEYARRFARQFVNDSVLAGDHVAVVHVQGTFTDSQAFTTSARLVLASVDRYGRGLSGHVADLTGPEMVSRNLQTYRAVQDLAERLGAMSGRRKAILWIGGQIRFEPITFPCPIDKKMPDPEGLCAVKRSAGALLAAYRDAISTANRHNVAIYPIDPSGLTTDLGLDALERTAALRMVAEDTGGVAVVGTNNLTGMYREIVRDNSTYYVLAYAPAVEHQDGKFHDIQVRVRRPDLRVRARKGYLAPRPDADTAPSLPAGVTVAARDALRMPVPIRGLALDVVAAPFRDAAGQASVVIGGQVSGDLRLEASEPIGFAYQVFDLEGRTQTGAYKRFTLDLQPDTRAQVADTGLRFADRILLPPGRYELRLVADQPNGAVGSVVVPLDVPDFDDALALSGVLLAASSTAGDLTLHEDSTAWAALGMAPTARRRFPQGDVLGAFVEVYTNDRHMTLDDLTVTGIITAADGTEVVREAAWRVPSDTTDNAAARQWSFTLDLNLADVPPGRYVLDVEAVSARRPDRPVRRRIPFTVDQP